MSSCDNRMSFCATIAHSGHIRLWYRTVFLMLVLVFLQNTGCVHVVEEESRLSKPITVAKTPDEDLTRISIVDVALNEVRDRLEQGIPYNVEYYYGYRGLNDERGVVIEFHPVDLANSECFEVLFTIKVRRLDEDSEDSHDNKSSVDNHK